VLTSRRMRTLAIDSSCRRASVALADASGVVARAENIDPAMHAERVIGLIDEVLAAAGWQKNALDLIACGVGPGSFTGVRVALATAKGIALGLDRPIVGIGSLEAMAFAYGGGGGNAKLILPLLDARKSELFFAAYRADASEARAPAHAPWAEIEGALAATLAGEARADAILLGEVVGELGLEGWSSYRSPATDLPDAGSIALLARIRGARADDLDSLEPTYVRAPDARRMDGA
jgi:tRNA threonylcarbamoyladenosine biosynthesis protein TsaB